ncbi:MAG: SDR family oxidoreductase [Pseudomonadota bacterium]
MNILVLGATGLIGSHLLRALRAAGHAATGASRHAPTGNVAPWRALDFASLTTQAAWLQHLAGFDAVVNCVGIFRERRAGDFDMLHRAAPAALFSACERLQIRRVIHISALGSASDGASAYWRSKGAAEDALRQCSLDSVIVRPSLVYGDDGASSRLFLSLATLPVLMLPLAQRARVQPVHIDDLVAALIALLLASDRHPEQTGGIRPQSVSQGTVDAALGSDPEAAPAIRKLPLGGIRPRSAPRSAADAALGSDPEAAPAAGELPRAGLELDAVGPRSLSIADYIDALRLGMGAAPAIVIDLPLPLARLATHAAALHPASPLTPDTLAMLEQGSTADAAPLRALLGRTPRDPATFARASQRPAAVLAWGVPLARFVLAVLWLWTAIVSWFGWPHADSAAWLIACGIPARWSEAMLLSASLLDGAIGIALLLRPRRWLWPLQLALVGGYTVLMTAYLPGFWLHPFGPLIKNLPLLALMLVLWRLDGKEK